MKRKNGFTLIELLAVIVILAIIALIATPIILGIVEDAKKDSFLRSVELLASTTDTDITNKTFEEDYTYTITDGVISNLEIGIKNTEGMNGSIRYDKKGNEIYAIHNGKYCVKKTEGMEKAEISEYVEGQCSIVTMYTNGQRVYFDVVKGTGCTMEEYASSYDGTDYQNSLTGYNGVDKTGNQNSCLLFYAFNDEGGTTINLLLDHNTTALDYWTESGNYSNDPIEVLNDLKNATSSWNGTITPENYTVYQTEDLVTYGNYTIAYQTEGYKARLITAQEIAKITGADTKEGLLFNESTSDFDSWFYFDSLSNSASSTCTSGDTSGCQYGWLYDRTSKTCKNFGCYNNADAGMTGYGYWTGTSAISSPTEPGCVWIVNCNGNLYYEDSDGTVYNGARPVITVLKSKISPGIVPVAP